MSQQDHGQIQRIIASITLTTATRVAIGAILIGLALDIILFLFELYSMYAHNMGLGRWYSYPLPMLVSRFRSWIPEAGLLAFLLVLHSKQAK